MASTYTTKQGDAWDAIAFHVYGDVKYTGFQQIILFWGYRHR